MNTKYILPQVLIAIVLWSISGFADYFDDQGNILGKFRTDYDSQTEGSAQNPLLIDTTGCDFPQSEFDTEIFIKVHATEACPTGPKIYPGGPFPYANISFSSSTFWVLSGNVELSFSDTNSAPLGNLQGPPNLSTNLNGTPDLLTFYMFPVFSGGFGSPPEKFTAQLIIDNEGGAAGKFSAAIPFIGLGGQKNRGNLGRVGSMNEIGMPHKTVWNSKVNIASVGRPTMDVLAHQITAIAEWGTKLRIIQVYLYHFNLELSDGNQVVGTHRHWNWSAKNSFWYPGADIVLTDAEDISAHCSNYGVGIVPRITNLGQTYTYSLNWEALYRCLSDNNLFDEPMPVSTTVPINGVHWSAELFGNASLWVAVSDMAMTL